MRIQQPKTPDKDDLTLRIGSRIEAVARGPFAILVVAVTVVICVVVLVVAGHLPR